MGADMIGEGMISEDRGPLQTLEARLHPSLSGIGFELVRLRLTGQRNPTLQVMIERTDGKPITVDDCADASHHISAILDVEDPIHMAYRLEVSSPGIARPLTRPKDFTAYKGYEIKLSLKVLWQNRRRFRGILQGMDGDHVLLEDDMQHEWPIPYRLIQDAQLVLTPALIGEATRNSP